MQNIYAKNVYVLEDFRDDCEHGVIGVYSSFEKAKMGLASVLKESIMSHEDELVECEDDEEWAEKLRVFIAEAKEAIKNLEKVESNSCYACNQLYITEHVLD